jgi:hypothetical protein
VKQTISYRTLNLIRWICICGVICSQLGLFIPNVAAQEPTSEPTSLPTPTPAPTWTPTPTPVNTPNPAATPTATSANPAATPAGRLVDFRVDDDEIDKGDCVMFSWVVRGDIDRVEFDKRDDDKAPVLVSAMDTRQECPDEQTDYDLFVTWLVDGTQTTRSIEIEVDGGGSGSGGSSAGGGTTTPAGTAVFVPVTPIPITGTPVSTGGGTAQQAVYQETSGGVIVTPVGVLGSVQVLPETGYLSPPAAAADPSKDSLAADKTRWRLWPALVGVLGVFLGMAILGLTLVAKIIREGEAPR